MVVEEEEEDVEGNDKKHYRYEVFSIKCVDYAHIFGSRCFIRFCLTALGFVHRKDRVINQQCTRSSSAAFVCEYCSFFRLTQTSIFPPSLPTAVFLVVELDVTDVEILEN